MSFIEWIFLLGGVAVIGPLIAHLLAKPRFKRLPFTMLRFLRTGQVQSQSRRKLRDLFILLLRCTIIILIALLFARPILHLKHKPKQTKHTYCLGLDNSMSIAYSDGDTSLFDKLKNSAIDYVRSKEPDSQFNICALASGDWLQDLSKDQALAEINALDIQSTSANIGNFLSGLRRANRVKHPDDKISALVFSDFTPTTLRQFIRIADPAEIDEIDYEPILSSKPVNNATIVEAHVVSMVENTLTISAAVANHGATPQKRWLTAQTGSQTSTPVNIQLLPNQREIYQVQIDIGAAEEETSFRPVELSLSNGDGLQADDTFYLAVSIPGQKDINVLLVGGSEHELFLLTTAMDTLSRMSTYNALRIRQVLFDKVGASDLEWSDVMVCSTITDRLGYLASNLRNFVNTGGKLICFTTELTTPGAIKQLWQQGILAALPKKCVHGRTYIQPKPCDDPISGVDHIAAKSLSNYRIDKILLKGYLECEPHAESRCLWQLQNSSGFVYLKPLGSGTSLFVNTSADDSLGTLTKSNASVAFCQYLLGQNNQIGEHSFVRDERVTLPLPDHPKQEFWVETCDGKKRRAAVSDTFLLVPDPAGIGWVKTLGKPTLYAGINLPPGETDMTQPDIAELDNIMKRVFPTNSKQNVSSADALGDKKPRPMWKIIAWAIILLLLIEPAIANRMRR
ncbi:MAG: BatA domain-containing protein [Sedimentisphaerales bacterium]|nr:BatA domain-containing protein [Sedimentisphaerales bacterium]